MDTIFALATAPGKSGVAVIRVSGAMAWESCSFLGFQAPAARYASLRTLFHEDYGTIDEALVLLFEDGQSFTGERVVEYQTHGSVSVVSALLNCLGKIPGFRPAEPGEFTKRALNNGRLDLTQVEALSDLIDAETELQRRQAQEGFSGRLRRDADHWRSRLVRATALVEASIDFADEDVPVDVSPEVLEILSEVKAVLDKEIKGFSAAERIRSGYEVAIVGAPNVGKSTLLNALAGREAAITSDVAGTTRDVIEVRMDIAGLPVTLLDTAGLRETEDTVEAIGVDRARERALNADLRVLLLEHGEIPDIEMNAQDIILTAKCDQGGVSGGISGLTGAGVTELIDRLSETLVEKTRGAGLISRERQLVAIVGAVEQIESAAEFVSRGEAFYDLAANEIGSAVRKLEALVGRVDVENLLDEIFSSFCIGK